MEHLDQEISDLLKDSGDNTGPARVLLVHQDDEARAEIVSKLDENRHNWLCVAAIDEAMTALAAGEFEIVMLQPEMEDNKGMALAEGLQQGQSPVRTVFVSPAPSYQLAVDAMRLGVVDVLASPVTTERLNAAIERGLRTSRQAREQQERLARLKDICQKLNNARQEVGQQVDVLCQDLVTAYQEIAEQVTEATLASEFRTLLKQELDLENLLRTTLEYLLTKTGPTNAAVFLPSAIGEFELGAYVNYDCPRETADVLLDHLCEVVCPHMVEERELIKFQDADKLAEWLGCRVSFLAESQVIAFACRHDDDCLALMVLFRDASDPFTDELAGILETLRVIFAEQVASVVRVHHRAKPDWPQQAAETDDEFDDEFGFGSGGLAA